MKDVNEQKSFKLQKNQPIRMNVQGWFFKITIQI